MIIACQCTDELGPCKNDTDGIRLMCDKCFKDCAPVALHFDDNKPELQYILAMPGLLEVARVNNYGAKKYGQWNYRLGMPWMELLGSSSRHLQAFIGGQDNDDHEPECKEGCIKHSTLPHLAHLCYNALMLLGYMKEHPKLDDRFKL